MAIVSELFRAHGCTTTILYSLHFCPLHSIPDLDIYGCGQDVMIGSSLKIYQHVIK